VRVLVNGTDGRVGCRVFSTLFDDGRDVVRYGSPLSKGELQ
jgi:hypothetical protein